MNIPIEILGKYHQNAGFSMAMLVSERVSDMFFTKPWKGLNRCNSLVLCPRLGLMVVGCVLGMTRRPFVVSRRRIRFFVLGGVRCLSSCVLGRWYLVCQSRPFLWRLVLGLLLPFRGLLGVLAFRLGFVRIWRCSLLRFGLFTRCVYPLFGERFVGLMARNPASYVSSLTLVTWDECARGCNSQGW